MNKTVLEVKNARTYFNLDEGILKAVDDVSFMLRENETLGLIGESGCGKSVTAHTILRTIQNPGKLVSGEVIYHDPNLGPIDLAKKKLNDNYVRSLRGKDISMIFQEPMASLSPVYNIGDQMIEAVMVHQAKRDKKLAIEMSLSMLEKVCMPNPSQQMKSYPHQLSGGMCQRAMIALALLNKPRILIADEPTTALDVTVQAQITELMLDLQKQFRMSILYITHDMGVIAQMADSVAVMYLGKIVEYASVNEIFSNPLHPYTQRLLKSIPVLGGTRGKRLEAIKGNVPVPLNLPDYCGFSTRCFDASDPRCQTCVPDLIEVTVGHMVSCFKYSKEMN